MCKRFPVGGLTTLQEMVGYEAPKKWENMWGRNGHAGKKAQQFQLPKEFQREPLMHIKVNKNLTLVGKLPEESI